MYIKNQTLHPPTSMQELTINLPKTLVCEESAIIIIKSNNSDSKHLCHPATYVRNVLASCTRVFLKIDWWLFPPLCTRIVPASRLAIPVFSPSKLQRIHCKPIKLYFLVILHECLSIWHLTLKTSIQSIFTTFLLMVMHHNTKFGWKRFISLNRYKKSNSHQF